MAYLGEGAFNVKVDYTQLKEDFKKIEALAIESVNKIEQAVSVRNQQMFDSLFKSTEESVDKSLDNIQKKVKGKGKGVWSEFFNKGTTDVLKGVGVATGIYEITRKVKQMASASISAFMDFEDAMASVKSKAFATSEEFKLMEETARIMGRTTRYNAIEAAKAMQILVEMGLEATEAIAALPKVLVLATTEGMDLARAADIAIGSMRGMNINVKDLDQVVDGLAFTAARSASTIESLGQALKVAGPAAFTSGQSLQNVLAVLGGLANRMIRNETAGFALTQMMARLTRAATTMSGAIDETGSTLGRARQTLQKLGIDVLTTSKTLRPLPDIFKEMHEKGMTTAETLNLFGVYTYKYALAAINASDTISELNDEMSTLEGITKGVAQRMADTKMDTLKGDAILAKNALVDLGIEIGKTFSPAARALVTGFTVAIKGVKSALDAVKGKGAADIRNSDAYLEGQGITPPEIPSRSAVAGIISGTAADQEYERIRRKFSMIRRDQFGLPIFGSLKIDPAFDRIALEELEKIEKEYDKTMKSVYSSMKIMTWNHYKYESELIASNFENYKHAIDSQYKLKSDIIDKEFNMAKSKGYLDPKEYLRFIQLKEDADQQYAQDSIAITQAQTEAQFQLLDKASRNMNARRLEDETKEKQKAIALAEAYNRLAAGMKESSSEYFVWKERALKEQYDKELLIVGKTEEGKFLVQQWYAEQVKQLHYQEVERLGSFVEGMQVSIDKLHDVGLEVGLAGEQFFNSMTGAGESALSEGFQNITNITDNWGEKMLDIFKSLSDNILKITSDLMAQLIVKWAIMKIFSATTGGIGSFNAGTGNYEGLGTSNTLFGSLGSSGTQVPMVAQTPFVSTNTMSSNRNMTRGNTFNQTIEMKIDATDANSFRKMLKRDGAEIQKIVGNGVKRNMGYASELRGRRE